MKTWKKTLIFFTLKQLWKVFGVFYNVFNFRASKIVQKIVQKIVHKIFQKITQNKKIVLLVY